MADIFERAWGNYLALLEFLVDPKGEQGGFNDQKGLVQPYNFASLLPYSTQATNYNNFLLTNMVNYVAPGAPSKDTTEQLAEDTRLEHTTQLVPNYGYFLNRLDGLIAQAVNPTDQPEYSKRELRVTQAQAEYSNYQRYIDGLWSDWIRNNPGIPAEELPSRRIMWERDNGHSMRLERLKRSIQFENAQLNAWLRSKIDASLHVLLEARTYFDDPAYQVLLPIAAQHDAPGKMHYWRLFPMQMPLMDLDEFLANDAKVTRKFLTKEEHYKRVEEKWKASVRGRWGIFSGGGSVEKRQLEELSTKTEFSCEVSFLRFEEVEIFRDRWFQPLLFDTVGKGFSEFWGPAGLLATYPSHLFMCRGMKVTVNVSDEYKRTLEKFISAGGSVSFGPFFSGGGSYSKDEKYMDFKLTQDGFELADGAKTIRLLGARVRRPNWSEDGAVDYLKGFDDARLSTASTALAMTPGASEALRILAQPAKHESAPENGAPAAENVKA